MKYHPTVAAHPSGPKSDVSRLLTFTAQGAISFYFGEARNFYGSEQYVQRLTTELVTTATGSAATTLAGQVLALGNASAVLAAAPTGTISGAFNYNQHNLQPFDMTGVRLSVGLR
jgi:hypothetical protein